MIFVGGGGDYVINGTWDKLRHTRFFCGIVCLNMHGLGKSDFPPPEKIIKRKLKCKPYKKSVI